MGFSSLRVNGKPNQILIHRASIWVNSLGILFFPGSTCRVAICTVVIPMPCSQKPGLRECSALLCCWLFVETDTWRRRGHPTEMAPGRRNLSVNHHFEQNTARPGHYKITERWGLGAPPGPSGATRLQQGHPEPCTTSSRVRRLRGGGSGTSWGTCARAPAPARHGRASCCSRGASRAPVCAQRRWAWHWAPLEGARLRPLRWEQIILLFTWKNAANVQTPGGFEQRCQVSSLCLIANQIRRRQQYGDTFSV